MLGSGFAGKFQRFPEDGADQSIPNVERKYVQLNLTRLVLNRFQDIRNGLQWGSEYRPFEHQKQLNPELFEVRISNGLVFKWSVFRLCAMYYTDNSNKVLRPVSRTAKELVMKWGMLNR